MVDWDNLTDDANLKSEIENKKVDITTSTPVKEEITNEEFSEARNIDLVKPVSSVKKEADDSDDELDESLSYATLRDANLKANMDFLASLKMDEAKIQLKEVSGSAKKAAAPSARGLKLKKEPVEPQIRRQSLRQRRIDPTGAALPEPEPVPTSDPWADPPRPPSGPLDFNEYLCSKAANVDEEDIKLFSETICKHKSMTFEPK